MSVAATESGDAALYRYRFANAELDESKGVLRVNGEPVPMERRPFALLVELLRHRNEVVSKEELFETVWAGQPTVDNVIANAIAKLRKGLGDSDGSLIVNVPRVGYRLNSKVERLVAALPDSGQLTLSSGQPVPRRESYVLEAVLSRTPHGEVWLARHAKLRNERVFKFAADGEQLMALKREYTLHKVLRRALGDRGDFVRVQDANLVQPPFHLECEYGGRDLRAWAQEGALEKLTLLERIGLFQQVARTVADAHNVGVLHKDLKPANVLIEARQEGGWHTRLTDFGSGRLLDAEQLQAMGITAMGLTLTQGITEDTRSGTLLYLAPELWNKGAPSVQSDVYALGVMLFQLLVGDLSRPITPGWEQEIADPLLRSDILAATHARPGDRLTSVTELLERLSQLDARREQALQEVKAQQFAQTVVEQTKRARLLRPWLMALGAAMALGLAATSWQWRRAEAQRLAAEDAARQEQATLEFLKEDVLGASDPFAGKGTTALTVRQALTSAANRVDARFQGFPEAQGSIHAELAGILHRYGELTQASTAWESAIKQLTVAFGAAHPATIAAMYRQSTTLSQLGQPDQAKAVLSRADAAYAELPLREQEGSLQVYQHAAYGVFLANQYKVNEALTHAEAALQIAKALIPPNATLLDRSYSDLSSLYQAAGQGKRNVALAQAWISALERRSDAPPNMQLLARSRLAAALVDAGRLEEAQLQVAELTPRMVALLGKTSNYTLLLRNLACDINARKAQRAAAVACLREVVADIRDAPNISPAHPWLLLANVGIYEAEDRHWQAADEALTEALQRLSQIPGTEAIQAMSLFPAVEAKLRLGDLPAAIKLRAKVDTEAAQNADPARPWGARLAVLDGLIAQKQGQATEANRLFEAASSKYDSFGKPGFNKEIEPLFQELMSSLH